MGITITIREEEQIVSYDVEKSGGKVDIKKLKYTDLVHAVMAAELTLRSLNRELQKRP